jgi:methionyl-tRNA formyltransferase
MIVAAYGQILPKSILQIPSHGCLNLHASLLPRHRGASPIQAAILDGDAETGITVMQMDEGLDTGDIILMEALPIGAEETAGHLHDRLAAVAAPCLARALQQIEDGSIHRIPQDNAQATYAPKLRKADGWLDWSKPAAVLERRVRAMSPWPGAFARLGGHILKIHETVIGSGAGAPGEVLASEPGELKIAAGEGCLILNSIQLEGRKRLAASEFLRGFPMPAGARFDLSFSHPD